MWQNHSAFSQKGLGWHGVSSGRGNGKQAVCDHFLFCLLCFVSTFLHLTKIVKFFVKKKHATVLRNIDLVTS